MIYSQQQRLAWFLLGLGLMMPLGYTSAGAEETEDATPPPGADRGAPSRQVDAGTRQPCGDFDPAEDGYLTALIPADGSYLTTATHPTFWVYLPFAAEDVADMTLTLAPWPRSAEPAPVSIDVDVPEALPGVVAIALPEGNEPLAIGQTYHWILEVSCSGPSQSGPGLFVMGPVTRRAPDADLQAALAAAATPAEQAAAYKQHGFWYDALDLMGERYQAAPDEAAIATEWTRFLADLELDLSPYGIDFNHRDIAGQPIVN